jgi:hypothetical protein
MLAFMQELLLFCASLAGTVIMSALAVIVRPDSPFWRVILWGAIGVFSACALLILLDYLRPGQGRVQLIGLGIGISITIGFGIALCFEPTTTSLAVLPKYGLGNPLVSIEVGSDQNHERIEHHENGLLRRSIYVAVCNNSNADIHDCNIRLIASTLMNPLIFEGLEKA